VEQERVNISRASIYAYLSGSRIPGSDGVSPIARRRIVTSAQAAEVSRIADLHPPASIAITPVTLLGDSLARNTCVATLGDSYAVRSSVVG
jgi:hypothetical protein